MRRDSSSSCIMGHNNNRSNSNSSSSSSKKAWEKSKNVWEIKVSWCPFCIQLSAMWIIQFHLIHELSNTLLLFHPPIRNWTHSFALFLFHCSEVKKAHNLIAIYSLFPNKGVLLENLFPIAIVGDNNTIMNK